ASPCSTPLGDGYSEYGVPFLGSRGYRSGAVTPHAAALALLVDPQAATTDLRALAERYNAYGDFGLYDGIDPKSGVVAHKYLALDQSMLFLALANRLDDHIVQRRFAADPIVQRVLPLLRDERFFE
ncbi:MAG TPA: glucoamylase family protein, partial [Candidatus Acidoferrales bacterium]|nr:glucoamylase family protein [Candidatus Acidoferrales bacterium]